MLKRNIMNTRNLLATSPKNGTYLVIGYSESNHRHPLVWQFPVIANEYGDTNIKKVVAKFARDLGLGPISIKDDQGKLLVVEVGNDTVSPDIVMVSEQDPTDVFEFRKFVTKEELLQLMQSQPTILGELHPH